MIRLLQYTVLALLTMVAPRAALAFTVDDFESVSDPSQALFFNFSVVGTGNSSAADLAQLDFGLAVTQNGSKVVFEFINESAISSVIAQIYFHDSGEALIGNGAVASSQVNNALYFNIGGGSPADLPGGNSIGFNANTSLTAYAKSPSIKNGLGVDEKLQLEYDLLADYTTISDALLDGTLRIGLHAQSIGSAGNSDAFIAEPYQFSPDPHPPQLPVPEPATFILLGIGTSFLVVRKRFSC